MAALLTAGVCAMATSKKDMPILPIHQLKRPICIIVQYASFIEQITYCTPALCLLYIVRSP
jgi:hypothetical protein